MFKRKHWIKIAEIIILFSVLFLIFWCHFFLLPGSEHGVGHKLFICEDAAFVIPVCPRLVYGNAVFAHLVKYCILPLPRKMSRNSVCPRQVSHFCGLDKSPALDNALSILLSSCSQHFFPVRVFASFIHLLPVVTLTDNESKQITAARSFLMSALLTIRTFLVKVKKI